EAAPEELAAIVDDIRGVKVPAALMGIWHGETGNFALKRDVQEVITLANRLDIFADYSLPAAQRVFTQLQTLASERVRPNLGATMVALLSDMTAGYDRLRSILSAVGGAIFLIGVATSAWVFVPMMRNISKAHEDFQAANASMETARSKAESADRAKS